MQPRVVDFVLFAYQEEILMSLGIPTNISSSGKDPKQPVNWSQEGF